MEYKAELNYLKIAPRKVRLVADFIRKMSLKTALEQLTFLQKSSARPLSKLILSAVANAKNAGAGFSTENLKIKTIEVNQGSILKRGRPVSKGMWHPIHKKTSHVKIVLTEKD